MDAAKWKQLHGFAAMLEQAPRSGAPVDMPEGARVVKITISDTFAQKLGMSLREASGRLIELEETVAEQREALEALRGQIELATEPQLILPPGAKH